jgi:hypothetical protein
MRPIDKIRNQNLPRSQGDHSTLYVSLELSRSTWRVTEQRQDVETHDCCG